MFSRWQTLSFESKLAWGGAALLVVWLLSGVFFGGDDEVEEERGAALPTVQVQTVEEVAYQRVLQISGHTEAERKAEIAAQTAGRVTDVPVVRGQQVTKGTVLVVLDPAERRIRLQAAESELARSRKLVEAGRTLANEGYMAATALAEREAAYQAAKEQVATARMDMSYATITAPFDGVVEDTPVVVGDYVNVGATVVVLVGRDNLLVVGNVAQADRELLEEGVVVSATLLNGQQVPATLRAIATDADESTRTYRVEAVIDGNRFSVPTGMSAKLEVPTTSTSATRIPHDWLVLADDGGIGVMRAVGTSPTVARFEKLQLLQDTREGVWVSGLGAGQHTLITRGQSSLRDGAQVIAAPVQQEVAQ